MPLANAVTWDPADTSNGLLSNGNLTFGANAGNSHAMVRGPRGFNSGKYYWEVGNNAIGLVFNCCSGLCKLTTTVANVEATGLNAALIMHYGGGHQAQANGASLWQNALGNYVTTCGFAVDLGTKRLWMRPTPTDSWNNDVTADPVAGVNGIDISFFSSALVTPFAQGYNSAGEPIWVLNAGQNAFAGTVPTGYTAGWPNAIVPAGFVNGATPFGNYRVLFTLSGKLDDTSGTLYPPTDVSSQLNGGHPQGNKIYFGMPDDGHSYDTAIVLFDTQAVNSAGPGTALAEWVFKVDGVDVSAGLVYDGFGTATLPSIILTRGFHALEVTNVVQLSAGGTYHGTSIPNSYKTDVITFSVGGTPVSLTTPQPVISINT